MGLIYRGTHALVEDPVLKNRVDDFIIQATAPFLLVLLVLTLLCWLPRLRELGRLFAGVPRWAWYCLGALCVGGTSLRLFWAPHGPQVFFDEINFLEIARGLAKDGDFLLPLRPSDDRVLIPIPAAWSFLLSLVFLVTGARIQAAIAVALGMAIFSLVLLFAVGWMLFRRPAPALFLTFALAVLPIHLRMSGSMALENGSLCWLLLTWVGVLAWQEQRRPVWLYCAGTSAAWCVNWRMENPFAVLPVLLVTALLLDPQPLRLLREKHFYLVLTGLAVFSLPGLACYVQGTGQGYYLFYGSEADRLAQVALNVKNNLVYWIDGQIHPPELTALALIGAFGWRPWRKAAAWILWFAALQLFYSQVPSADFGLHHTLDSWRNALQPALGLLVLAAAGLEALRAWLAPRVSRPVLGGLLLLLLVPWLTHPLRYDGFVQSKHVWQHEFSLMREVGARLPTGARLMADGRPEHLRSTELHLAELSYATGRDCGLVVVSREAFARPGVGDPPGFLVDLDQGLASGRRAFLYYFGVKASPWDFHRRDWLAELLHMRLVAGSADPVSGFSFTLYEVDGLTRRGQNWLDQRQASRPGGP